MKKQWLKQIEGCYERAPLSVLCDGLAWYVLANAFCATLAEKYKLPLETIAGVVSALSPACPWERNKKDAERLVKAFHQRGWLGAHSVRVSTYGKNKHKAISILLGNTQMNDKGGLKTYNFYQNILHPNDDVHVTIDRHAFNLLQQRAAGGVRINKSTYTQAAECFKHVAKRKGLTPCQLQAIVWVQWRAEQRTPAN